ncbi:sigma-70 family RNA polymerase sigma factor [Solibacillus sp. MA9]|uniref:Sigma-70 family RNA polymerase sigma factor n=1 Tax=Solibacillus palustris TaxID=2908203 RepID=A0ABS9UAK1_9BACL|nr:sigma-70 family RNA polymerase sigma factor [Solibacillus sp. MA9]MCH7321349.1 sigma-70 family RNA polymerase sigma factor [Solibacillus sp. MA9]
MELERLYSTYVNDIYRYLFSLCRHPETAEDLLQDTFYKVHVTLLAQPIYELKPWLFKVAYYSYIDHCRKEKRSESYELLELVDYTTPEMIFIQKDSFTTLLNLLDQLNSLEKQAILLCDIQNCTNEQAAQILDLKLNTLKSHLLRGRKKMRSLIEKGGL